MSVFKRFPRTMRAASMVVAGTLQALTFAPGPLPDGALAALQVLMLAVVARRQLTSATARGALWDGWLFSFASYSLGLYWIFISLNVYGGLAAPLAVAAVLALSAFLAVFPAAAGVLARWLAPLPAEGRGTTWQCLRAVLAFGASWAALEWIRGNLWTGFPWLNIAYAHVDSPFAGWAPVLGVYGIDWLAAFAAAALAALWQPANNARLDKRRAVPAAIAVLAALAGWGLAHVQWAEPSGAPLQVRLIQGNVEQSEKFDGAAMEKGLLQHMNQAALPPAAGETPPQLIVLPETVLPVFQDQLDPRVWNMWRRIAAERGTTIIMGVPLHRKVNSLDRYTNSAIGFDGNTSEEGLRTGELAMRYDKQHLVPWGEFVPPGFHWFVQMLDIPLGDFDRGDLRQHPFDVADQRVALNICYEDLFGEEMLPAILPGANGEPGASILLNISNLGWFGDSWALRQHLQIGRMRTLETARPMLTATNTGLTAAIDHHGRITAEAPPFQATALVTTVQGTSGLTPYTRTGNWLMEILIALTLLGLGAGRMRARRREARDSV
jgi:apolipoprotein N-acyltransferase